MHVIQLLLLPATFTSKMHDNNSVAQDWHMIFNSNEFIHLTKFSISYNYHVAMSSSVIEVFVLPNTMSYSYILQNLPDS